MELNGIIKNVRADVKSYRRNDRKKAQVTLTVLVETDSLQELAEIDALGGEAVTLTVPPITKERADAKGD